MTQRDFERTIETLSRAELRALVMELTAWVGESAVPRLYPAGPIRPSTRQAQLALAAVDVDASATRREHVLSLSLGLLRAPGALQGPPPDLSETHRRMAAAWAELEGDAVAALRFDFPAGLTLASALVRASVRVRTAMETFGGSVPEPSLGEVFGLLGERASATALDERTFGQLVALCSDAAATLTPGVWAPVGSVLAVQPDARRWLIRRFESGAVRKHALVPLLEALAATEGPVEDVVQVGEICLDGGVAVFEVMVRALHSAARIHEARFWIGEGRLRHPGSETWSELEGSLF